MYPFKLMLNTTITTTTTTTTTGTTGWAAEVC